MQAGLIGGLSMDLTIGYDFNKFEGRQRAWRHVQDDKPLVLIGSPMCTMFSQLQRLNWGHGAERDAEMQRKFDNVVGHMEFVCSLYRHQVEQGRFFLHGHPKTTFSWDLKCICEIKAMKMVRGSAGRLLRFRADVSGLVRTRTSSEADEILV